jgi:DNA polymerase III alpha subunit
MGKKIPEVMAEQEDKFKKGCLDGGMEKGVVNHL